MSIQKRVILAAGHGGGDNGAAAQGTTEAHETVQITDRVAELLRKAGGIEVVVVPHSLNLGPTIDWINARYKGLGDGLAIEIHKNSGGGTGSEVWAPSYPDATSKQNAAKIADALAAATGQRNRGVKEAQHNRWGRLGFTDDTRTYALLIEAGFIDVDPVDDGADSKYAQGIAQGILNIFGSTAVAPTPAPVNPAPARASNETVAQQIVDGVGGWGNGDDRKKNLAAKGYDYATIQSIVNRRLSVGTQTVSSGISLSAVVDKVLNGDYGNNPGRADKLRAAGFDPNTVQAAVNARLGVAGAAPVASTIQVGSSVVVTNPVDVNGVKLGTSGVYDVIEANGDRLVIGKGSAVTAAIRRQNVRLA